MTMIWKETGFINDDPWVIETDERKAANGERVLIPFKDIVEDGLETNGTIGICLTPSDDPRALSSWFERIDMIALTFPAFGDGRAFSQAALLRSRLGYKGEIRAIGDVLIDQLVLMLRCGFDSFAVSNETAIRRLREGRLPAIDHYYQPAIRQAARANGYSWRRTAQ